jgi:homoserine O-succinyltransferase
VPHSRFGFIDKKDYQSIKQLKIIAESPEAGVYLVATENKQQVYVTGHSEYDATTLHEEFLRDITVNKSAVMPVNYYPDNDKNNLPVNSWRSHGSLLFTNWLNYYVYQITPYKLDANNIQAIQVSKSGAPLEK